MNNNAAEQVLSAWIEGVNQGDLDRILALYDTEGTLIPTFSSQTAHGKHAIRDYFQKLSEKGGVQVTLDAPSVRAQNPGTIAILTGFYTFRFASNDADDSYLARFSFVLDLSRPSPILHHHSSRVPEPIG